MATVEEAPTPPPDQPTSDAQVAAALAEQVKASADGVTWRKMTTLLDLFGAYRLTTKVRERIATALSEAGLDPKPLIADAERFETIRLTVHEEAAGQDDDEHDPRSRSRTMSRLLPIDDVLEVTEWRPGHAPEKKSLFQCTPTDEAV